MSMAEAREIFGPAFSWHEDPVWVGLSTLAMGDTMAVEFAQAGHIGLCLRHGVASVDELITLHGSLPRGLLQVGIIVDDLIFLEQVLRGLPLDECELESDRRVANAEAAYRRTGLIHNPGKTFKKQVCSRFWGLEVDGDKGLLRSSSLRLWPVAFITMRVVSLGLATIGLLEALAGSWVSLYGIRRRMFCCLDVIFKPLCIEDQKAVVRLSPDIIAELTVLVVLGSLAVVNLRATYLDQVIATDASSDCMAAVAAACPAAVVKEVSRHALKKGIWTKLLPSSKARDRAHGILDSDDEVPGERIRGHPLWNLMARALDYEVLWREFVHRPTHVNILELRAYLREEKRLASRRQSVRVLSGLDSQVALGALVKGRSSSRALNNEMRRFLGPALGGDIYGLHMYYDTAYNPADDPTRSKQVRAATIAKPHWWQAVESGSNFELGQWLRRHGASDDFSGVDLGELCGDDAIDLRPQRLVRSDPLQREKHVAHVPPSGREGFCCPFGDAALDVLRSFKKSQFVVKEGEPDFTKAGALDLFSGRCGVARQMVKLGVPWVLTFDWKRCPSEDLLDPELRGKIELLFS